MSHKIRVTDATAECLAQACQMHGVEFFQMPSEDEYTPFLILTSVPVMLFSIGASYQIFATETILNKPFSDIDYASL